MPFIKWKPLEELETAFEALPLCLKSWDLAVDVSEDDTAVIVEMHVPGVTPDDIDIEVADNYLVVSGMREEEEEKKEKHFHMKEIRRGTFERTISLPATVIADETYAEFKKGALKIILPKEKAKRPHKVKVKEK